MTGLHSRTKWKSGMRVTVWLCLLIEEEKKKGGGSLIRVHEVSVIRTNISFPFTKTSVHVFFNLLLRKRLGGLTLDPLSVVVRTNDQVLVWSGSDGCRNDMIYSTPPLERSRTDEKGLFYWKDRLKQVVIREREGVDMIPEQADIRSRHSSLNKREKGDQRWVQVQNVRLERDRLKQDKDCRKEEGFHVLLIDRSCVLK